MRLLGLGAISMKKDSRAGHPLYYEIEADVPRMGQVSYDALSGEYYDRNYFLVVK